MATGNEQGHTCAEESDTLPVEVPQEQSALIPRLELNVIDGNERGTVVRATSGAGCAIGTLPNNALVLSDPTVSRFHCQLSVVAGGVRIRDLGSLNGTWVQHMRLQEAVLPGGTEFRVGRVSLRVDLADEANLVPASRSRNFGSVVGGSEAMRRIFAILQRVAPSQSTILLEGETGSGKGAVARAIHEASARANAPFSVVDCGALPPTLLESELFGHERGAFTGASERRIGAFEEADGGTLFLDEIGELPIALQPKLLRVLEDRTIKRLGSNTTRPINVRIVIATNRDLREEVNRGTFRADLFFRISVVPIHLPPLRDRPEDILPLARALLAAMGQPSTQIDQLLDAEMVLHLSSMRWPGNVRELRNYLERALLVSDQLLLRSLDGDAGRAASASASYAAAKARALTRFEREYVTELLSAHAGKVAAAASAAELTREHVYRLIRRHGIALKS